jgi:hypothetical protein
LQEGAGGLPHAWPANTHYKATPLPTTSGFLRYFRACSLIPVRQGAPRVPQGTWGVLWKRMVCPYWMLMEFPISLYHWVGLLAHKPNALTQPGRPVAGFERQPGFAGLAPAQSRRRSQKSPTKHLARNPPKSGAEHNARACGYLATPLSPTKAKDDPSALASLPLAGVPFRDQ